MQCDILIVGGGLTGLLTLAAFSKHKKIKALLIDSDQVGKRSSGRSIGEVIAGPPKLTDITNFEKLFYIHRINNDLLQEFIKKEKLGTVINNGGSVRLAETEQQTQDLLAINKVLPKYTALLDQSEISHLLTDKLASGLFVSGDYSLNPYDLILSLKEKYKDKIIENATITSAKNKDGKMIITLADETMIIPNKVVYTINVSYASPLLKPHKKCIFALKVTDDSWHQQIFANFIFNDVYFRVVNEYIFISVPNITTNLIEEDTLSPNNQFLKNLHRMLNLNKTDYEYSWSQVSANTKDSLPLIGKVDRNEYVNIGYGVHGINCSFLGSLMAVNEALELNDNKCVPWSNLFHINRFSGA